MLDHATSDINTYEIAQVSSDIRGAEFKTELRKRLCAVEYRRDALACVLSDDDEAHLQVWDLLHIADTRTARAARAELHCLIDRHIEAQLDLEFTKRANDAEGV